jgi:hypothetical protein
VIAGGGGRGAPLFSRPKPQSQGRTPGGARQLRHARRAVDHSATRRGENAEQSTATTTSEAPAERAAAPAEARPGAGGGTGSSPAARGERDARGREVTGTLVGDGLAGYGAPGLRGAGAGSAAGRWPAIAIGAAALLFGLGGWRLEWRRGEALP